MEKRHLSRVVWWETVYVAACSLTAGLILGIALDKVMFLLITRGIGGGDPLGFFSCPEPPFGKRLFCLLLFF